jgi:hypothetical protein
MGGTGVKFAGLMRGPDIKFAGLMHCFCTRYMWTTLPGLLLSVPYSAQMFPLCLTCYLLAGNTLSINVIQKQALYITADTMGVFC